MEGVDYSTARPSPAGLYAAGKRFVIRYGGAGTTPKWLTPSEARALIDAGLSIVANVEGTASGLLNGWNTGVHWAQGADANFRFWSMPADRPIYLSVDFDVQAGQWPAVADALRGAASVIGVDRVGVYGGRNAMRWARRDGVARWFWQTYAWSGRPTEWIAGNHIEQYRNGVTVAGGDCDLNRSLTVDFGQWPVKPQEATMSDVNPATDTHAWHGLTRLEALVKLWERSILGEDMPIVWLLKSLPTKEDVSRIEVTPEIVAALATALEPALELAVENVLSRTGLIVRPRI